MNHPFSGKMDRIKVLSERKELILATLVQHDIAVIEIAYDGAGDSGQVEQIEAYDAAKTPLPDTLLTSVTINYPTRWPKADTPNCMTLRDALDEFAYDLLDEFEAGFENNEGGSGTITIHVAERRATLEHCQRIVDTYETEHEV